MTLDDLHAIAVEAAPELRDVLRLTARADDWAEVRDCSAFATFGADIVFCCPQPSLELCLHELGHVVPVPSAETVAHWRAVAPPERAVAIAASGRGFGDLLEEWRMHGPEFVRNVIHLATRCERHRPVDWPRLNASGYAYGSPPLWLLRDALGTEPAECLGMTFAEIAAKPTPAGFVDLFQDYRDFYTRLMTRDRG